MHIGKNKQYARAAGMLILAFALLLILFREVVLDNPVFDFNPSEKQTTSWEQFLNNREKLNAKKMKLSYGELMSQGRMFSKEKNWGEAHLNFYFAKTLFPDRIGPRKNLCYSYLMMCQDDWRFCDKARKELYYAMKYVQPTDKISYDYLTHLVELADMEDIIEMDEGEALAAIF